MEREKVQQFVSVTGSSEDIAKKYLEACGGDLDMAVGMHLEAKASSSSAVESGSVMNPDVNYERIHGVRAPIPQTTGVLIEEETPARKVLRSRKLPQTVFDPFQDYSAIASRTGRANDQAHTSTKQNLAEMFRPPHDLLFNGTFHEAKLAGQQKHCWLLINLQDSKEFGSQILNRDVWSNYNVKDLIRRHFIFMQIYRINDEGVQFKQLYNIDSYPCIAVIDPRTGEKMISWGALTADGLIQEISQFLASNHFEGGGHMDQPYKNSIINLSEESQIEAAIKASLLEVPGDKHALEFSDDSDIDYISFSPSEESNVLQKTVTATKSVGQPSCDFSAINSSRDEADQNSATLQGPKQESLKWSRKRLSNSNEDEQNDCPRKRIRTDLDPVCVAMDNIELTQPVPGGGKGSTDSRLFNGKGRKGKKSKGKEKAKATKSDHHSVLASTAQDCIDAVESVEELLASGNIHKDEITQILFRLPDGSRLQKSFLSKQPISALLSYLEGQGIKLTEHEIVTHFPRRSLFDMDKNSSFKHNKLYPRETIFIHTV